MPKITFIISEENNAQLLEIQRRYGLAKTDSVRRGIALLFDYLVKDVQPEASVHVKVEPKEAEKTG
jgi:hypothetical protein